MAQVDNERQTAIAHQAGTMRGLRMTPRVDLRQYKGQYYEGTIYIKGVGEVRIRATKDFEIRDPWSLRVMVPTIEAYRDMGWFDNETVMELGIGDGRNILHAGNTMNRIIGVDINEAKIEYVRRNIDQLKTRYEGIPIELYSGDAVEFLMQWGRQNEQRPGRVLMCLPQSHGAGSSADVFDNRPEYAQWTHWNPYALTLNAAALAHLRPLAHEDTRVLAVFSDRIPPLIKQEMFDETGWGVVHVPTSTLVQQDPDTDLSWMLGAFQDDGQRFFDGTHTPLRISEAVDRVRQSGGVRENLDLYHYVSVYELAPAPFTMSTAAHTVPETVSHVS